MNGTSFMVREEDIGDGEAISTVHRAAFETPGEARLVIELRNEGMILASHVAVEGDEILAHALYSRMYVETNDGLVAAVALGPIAVLPHRQNAGLGSAVIRAGLEAVRTQGERLILVLGHPRYYPRFGFDPAVAARIQAPWSGAPWMGIDLHGEPITGQASSFPTVLVAARHRASIDMPMWRRPHVWQRSPSTTWRRGSSRATLVALVREPRSGAAKFETVLGVVGPRRCTPR